MPTLVVHQGAIGDLLISLPALRLLKKHVGDFTLAGQPERCLFLKDCGEVSSVFPSSSAAFAQLFTGTIAPHFDYFDEVWWFSRRRGLVPTILMMPDSRLKAKVIFTVDEGPDETNCSIFQFDQVRAQVKDEDAVLKDFLNPLGYFRAESQRQGFDLVIHPGSGSARKNFPLSLFFDVTKNLIEKASGMSCCFILGPAEGEMAKDVEDFALRWDGRVKIASGFGLGPLADLLGKARVYWGNDSGITHLAAWCGTRTFVNFGPTNPRLWAPVLDNATTLMSSASCSPCGDSYRRCQEPVCLEKLSREEVLSVLSFALGL